MGSGEGFEAGSDGLIHEDQKVRYAIMIDRGARAVWWCTNKHNLIVDNQ